MTLRLPPLSPRLGAIADLIVPGSRVADVGTGHGNLPLWLVASGRAAYCLATERSVALLRRVARAPATASWAPRLNYRDGDGLGALCASDRIDTIVLAGLGGRAVVRILDAPSARTVQPRRLVLQPRTEHSLTRLWLSQHGWRLVAERLVLDRGQRHLTIVLERGADTDVYEDPAMSLQDLLAAGPLLARSGDPEVMRAWQLERDRFASILARPGGGPSVARARAGLAQAERVLAAISRRGG